MKRFCAMLGLCLASQMTPIEAQGSLRDELASAEAKWQANKPASYEFTIEVRCFCALAATPPTFRVLNGVPSPLGRLEARERWTYGYYDTIDELFAVLQRTISRGAFKAVVQYDKDFGYPMSADLDPVQYTADDELFFRVTAFKPIPARDPR
jgi:hypothetical protein